MVRAADVLDIRRIVKEADEEVREVETTQSLPDNAVILDIRSPEEEERAPLKVQGSEVKHLPFYRLSSQFADLDQQRHYYLYCDRGVMSRMQALLLHEQGYTDVKVYRPKA